MQGYQTRPDYIQACQFTGEPDAALEQWLGPCFESWIPSQRQLCFHAIRGEPRERIANAGDWVIRKWQAGPGVRFAVCPPRAFVYRYEPLVRMSGQLDAQT